MALRSPQLALTLLTLIVLAVHGYHPYSEDGGLYLAGIRKLLDPGLYPLNSEFVTEHLRFSLFAPTVAAIVRITHLALPLTIFVLYLVSIWATLGTVWMLAARVRPSLPAKLGAVSLAACWLVLPVAGTSLMLTDPYLTARSWSTPLTLLATCWALTARHSVTARKSALALAASASALLCAAVFHPLMAAYGLAAVLLLLTRTRRAAAILGLCAIALAAILQTTAPPESADYIRIAMTRYYWFPLRWQWYEQIGLVAPLLLLVWFSRTLTGPDEQRTLARAATRLGCIASTVAVLFCRVQPATHLVARLQPLRTFNLIYLIMITLLGSWLGEHLLRNHRARWLALYAGLGCLMFFVSRTTYPASAHVELPFGSEAKQPHNPWERAFVWSATNTPRDALFALDAHYITRDGEDAQLFRALAQRSSLADYSKDGGEASITPSLTSLWVQGQIAQNDIEIANDATRAALLAPLGVTWLILNQQSATALPCPYRNEAVKVCRLIR